MEVLLFAVALGLNIGLSYWVVARDIARGDPIQWARSWPDSSLWAAVVAFNFLAIPIHFLRTRRSFRGLGLGLCWMVAVVAAIAGIQLLLELVIQATMG